MYALYLLNSLVLITHPLPLLRLRGPGFVRNRDLGDVIGGGGG